MTAGSPTALVGAPVSYTITANNLGGDTSYTVNVQDAFPAYPLLHPATFTASAGVFDTSTGLWNIASLGSGLSETLTVNLNAPNIAGALTNQSTAFAGTNDPSNANNTASATTTILSPAVITGTMAVAGTTRIGGTVTYTVVLSNSSAYDQQDNPGNELMDVLPSTLTLVSANATSGTAVATVGTNTVTWTGSIPAGGNITVTITATVNGTAVPLGTISNQGDIAFDADGNGTNESSAMTTPAPTSFTVLSPAAVSASMTVAGDFYQNGLVTYTVVLSNAGPSPQLDNPGDEFVDVLPSQLVLDRSRRQRAPRP